MTVTPGTLLGVYEVVALLGEGGMGQVYRARDTTLNRDVALKILTEAVAADPDRLARFTREAQTLAALNHPNIAHIHGVEGSGEVRALVMELVEGEDLSELIARGPVAISDVLPLARQMADALEAAHDQGIVHRDLKPANVKVRRDGTIKVLDFGLAKATDATGSSVVANSPTFTSPALLRQGYGGQAMTQAGMILGTAAYMSPEQARGKAVDKRADIWAFGLVVYEMLTGRAGFGGETITDVLAAVVSREPDWTALPPTTPASIKRLLARCLEKDPKRRLRDIGDARLELDQAGHELLAPEPTPAMPRAARSRGIVLPIATLAALAIGAAAGTWWQRSPDTAAWSATQVGGPRITLAPRLSPDGRMLAFITVIDGQSQVAVMDTSSGDWSLLTTARDIGPVIFASWSRDGTRVYFDRFNRNGRQMYSVSPLGGEPRLVLDNAFSAAPLPDGSLLFLRLSSEGFNQLHRFWAETGRIQAFPIHVHLSFAPSMRALPDGREAALFGRLLTEHSAALQLMAVDLESGATRLLSASQDFGDYIGSDGVVPVGVSADGREILTTTRTGGASRVVAIARDGRSPPRPLFTTTRLVAAIEEAGGHYYVDQVDRSLEHLRVAVSGGVPERLTVGLPTLNAAGALALANGRFLYATEITGRPRLVIGRPGQELVPFVETQEQARAPMARVSDREFVFVAGTRESPVLAIASSETGRIVRRLDSTRGRQVTRLAVSPDGATVYFSAGGIISTVPIGGGEVRELTRGNGIAPDPLGRFVVIDRPAAAGSELLRRDPDGTETLLALPPGIRATGLSVWSTSLDARGRLLFVAETDDSWFWGPAVLDLQTNQAARIPMTYAGDAEVNAAWDGDGHITVLARRTESTIWRFEQNPQ